MPEFFDQDVYYGDTEKPLPDWRTERIDPEQEREAVKRVLGFDPRELNDPTPPSTSS